MKIAADLPEIKVVRHARAKRIKLSVSSKGIRLTLSPSATQHQAERFVTQQLDWLKQAWQKHQDRIVVDQDQPFPSTLNLCYLTTTISVEYADLKTLYLYDATQATLILNQQQSAFALTQFIIAQAKVLLINQLKRYAAQHDLHVRHVRIATPNTRWGSCRHDQSIMLHAGLLLMSKADADYVILHELTHTRHMHHQASFWQCLEQFFPNAKVQQKQVKRFKLPNWWTVKIS